MTLPRFLTATAAVLLLSTGCSASSTPRSDGPVGTPKQKDMTVQVKTQAEVEKLVKQLAESVASEVGSPLHDHHSTAAPCGDGGTSDVAWSLSGVATVAVKPADQISALTGLRDAWQGQGYEITEFHLVPAGAPTKGSVSARRPGDALTVTVQSTGPLTGLAIIVATPCYQPAPGENPGN